jgi:uncharacterized protein YutE (UPF0331/DUF86 family)
MNTFSHIQELQQTVAMLELERGFATLARQQELQHKIEACLDTLNSLIAVAAEPMVKEKAVQLLSKEL